jgi:hypothetical protein
MNSPLRFCVVSVNHTLTCEEVAGSIERNPTPVPLCGSEYSLNNPEDGQNAKILSDAYSVPQTTVEPAMDVTAKSYGFELEVGILHSWNMPVEGSR